MDWAVREISRIQEHARGQNDPTRCWPWWSSAPPKGWTCPKEVDGLPLEGTAWPRHPDRQRHRSQHIQGAGGVDASYRPEELF